MYIKDSPCWSLPLELNNLALFTSTHFWFHVGMNRKHLNVHSSFYTEMIKYTAPSPHFLCRLSCTFQVQRIHLKFWIIRCLYFKALSIAKGYLTVSQFSLFDRIGPHGEGKSPFTPQRLCSKLCWIFHRPLNFKFPLYKRLILLCWLMFTVMLQRIRPVFWLFFEGCTTYM